MPAAEISTTPIPFSLRAQMAGGQPISEMMTLALAHPNLISLAAGFVDQATLPAEATREAIDAIFSDRSAALSALQYGTTVGFGPLREAILTRMAESDGRPIAETGLSTDQVVITAGSNQLLHLVAETLFDPGDIVLCAAPSYFVFLGTLANLGVRAIGVTADEDGLNSDAVDEELTRLDACGELSRVKAIYVTSYFDNPCSVSLAAERRPRLVEVAQRWSREHRIHVIEDAAYRELRYEGDDLPSLRAFDESSETVIVAGTFSKSFSPGIRVGWGILPRELVGPVCDQKGNFDFGSPNFAQHLMSKVLDLGLFDDHAARLRESYRTKRDAMLDAADEFLAPQDGVSWIHPRGGLYVWVTLPPGIETGPQSGLFQAAMDEGVLYVPGIYCYPPEGVPPQNTMRLSFGVQPVDKIRNGMRLLGEAISSRFAGSLAR